jgi:hypothetical protein
VQWTTHFSGFSFGVQGGSRLHRAGVRLNDGFQKGVDEPDIGQTVRDVFGRGKVGCREMGLEVGDGGLVELVAA